MFLYAWLVDRFSPALKKGAVHLAQVNFHKTYRQLPRTTVDLGERKDWVVERHVTPTWRCSTWSLGTAGTNGVVLPPVARKPLPTRAADEDVLTSAYGDVVEDVVRLAARILLRAGRTDDVDAGAAVANVAPLPSKPEAFEALADEIGGPLADELRRFAVLSRCVRNGLSQVVMQAGDTTKGGTVDDLAVRLAAGDVDTTVVVDMQVMRARLESEIDAKVRGEIVERSATLDLDDLFDALEVVTTASRAG